MSKITKDETEVREKLKEVESIYDLSKIFTRFNDGIIQDVNYNDIDKIFFILKNETTHKSKFITLLKIAVERNLSDFISILLTVDFLNFALDSLRFNERFQNINYGKTIIKYNEKIFKFKEINNYNKLINLKDYDQKIENYKKKLQKIIASNNFPEIIKKTDIFTLSIFIILDSFRFNNKRIKNDIDIVNISRDVNFFTILASSENCVFNFFFRLN